MNILHSSKSTEYYTPSKYVEAARRTLGGKIDLDPASCLLANQTVKAKKFFTKEENGLNRVWRGTVWLNPPYGKIGRKSTQGVWAEKLISEYDRGNVTEAILLVNAVPSARWFAPLWRFLLCFTKQRIRFNTPFGVAKSPTHSNVFIYLGQNHERFAHEFKQFGALCLEYRGYW